MLVSHIAAATIAALAPTATTTLSRVSSARAAAATVAAATTATAFSAKQFGVTQPAYAADGLAEHGQRIAVHGESVRQIPTHAVSQSVSYWLSECIVSE